MLSHHAVAVSFAETLLTGSATANDENSNSVLEFSGFQRSCSLMVNVPRPRELDAVGSALRHVPITALFGPSQCGKTTSARSLQTGHFFDLEDPRSFARQNARQTGLEGLTGMVVID